MVALVESINTDGHGFYAAFIHRKRLTIDQDAKREIGIQRNSFSPKGQDFPSCSEQFGELFFG